MSDVQLFRDREFSIRFDRWIAQLKNLQSAFLWNFNDNIASSKTFGEFIYDNNLSDLVPFFSREYFSNNWTAIISAFEVAGTFECYLIVIRSAIGEGTIVNFEVPSESHLIINITNPTGLNQWSAYSSQELKDVIPDQIQYPDSTLVFQQSISNLTINEMLKLIELLNVNGVYVEVNLVA